MLAPGAPRMLWGVDGGGEAELRRRQPMCQVASPGDKGRPDGPLPKIMQQVEGRARVCKQAAGLQAVHSRRRNELFLKSIPMGPFREVWLEAQ